MDCVIPVAGASSRMGAFKPLLPFGLVADPESTVVETTVAQALAASDLLGEETRVVLVTGYRGPEVAARFGALRDSGRVLVVENPDWARGMLGSLQRGIAVVEGPCWFTVPADMPLVGPGVYAALLAARVAGSHSRRGVGDLPLFAAYRGEAGHPVLIPSTLTQAIAALPPGERLRPFLLEAGGRLVETGDPAVLADLDTADDYRRVRTLARSIAQPEE